MRVFNLLFLFIFLSSCAAWKSGEEEERFPVELVEKTERPKLTMEVLKVSSFNNGEDLPNFNQEKYKQSLFKIAESVFQKNSKAFTYLASNEESNKKDMSVQLELKYQTSRTKWLEVVNYVTVFLVPARILTELTLTVRFLDKKDVVVGMVEKTAQMVEWRQLFMLFVMPFHFPLTAEDTIIEDLIQASIEDAVRDGYFIDINS